MPWGVVGVISRILVAGCQCKAAAILDKQEV